MGKRKQHVSAAKVQAEVEAFVDRFFAELDALAAEEEETEEDAEEEAEEFCRSRGIVRDPKDPHRLVCSVRPSEVRYFDANCSKEEIHRALGLEPGATLIDLGAEDTSDAIADAGWKFSDARLTDEASERARAEWAKEHGIALPEKGAQPPTRSKARERLRLPPEELDKLSEDAFVRYLERLEEADEFPSMYPAFNPAPPEPKNEEAEDTRTDEEIARDLGFELEAGVGPQTLASALSEVDQLADSDLARAVDELIDDCRSTCLWHQRPDYYPADDEARVRVLDEILGHADRATFIRASKLRQRLLARS